MLHICHYIPAANQGQCDHVAVSVHEVIYNVTHRKNQRTGILAAGGWACNATCRLCDGSVVILHQRVRGSVRANWAVRKTWVFLTATRFVADDTQCLITATMAFPETIVSKIDIKIVNSQHSPSCMNMIDVIIELTKHQTETQNLSKILQIITHPSTLQSSRKIATNNTNPWTTVQLAHSILTMTNLQPGGCLNASNWPMSPQHEDSRWNRAQVAKPHCERPQPVTRNRQTVKEQCLGQHQAIPARG